MDEKLLEEIGLTRGEIDIYLALLKVGETTTGKLIEEANISGSKVYVILDKLIKKGLVGYIIKEKTKHFSAANPDSILDYVEKKESLLHEKKERIKRQLPSLKALQEVHKKEHETTLFVGLRGIETAVFQALNEMDPEEEVLAMGVRTSKAEKFNIMWEKWHKERARRKINGKFLFSERNSEIDKIFSKIKRTEIKYLEGITPSAVAIFGDTIIIQTYDEDSSALLIKNEQISNSFKTFFWNLWGIAK